MSEKPVCLGCGQPLHTPDMEALQKLRDMGFNAGQFCCSCFNVISKLYAILSNNKQAVVILYARSHGDGQHYSWWATARHVVVRGLPVPPEEDDWKSGYRGKAVLGRPVYANPKIIILKFLRWVSDEEELEPIADRIYKLREVEK